LFRFDAQFADDYLQQPDVAHDRLEKALRTYPLPVDGGVPEDSTVQVVNTATGDPKLVGETRSDDIGNVVPLAGQVTKRTAVKPRLKEAAFECQRCGTLERIPQEGQLLSQPHECEGCERQGPYNINEDQSVFTDHQQIRIQKPPEQTDGGSSDTTDIHLNDSLVGNLEPGDRVEATGVLRLAPSDDEKTVRVEADLERVNVTWVTKVMENLGYEKVKGSPEEAVYELAVDEE